jgi:hypothetical protein
VKKAKVEIDERKYGEHVSLGKEQVVLLVASDVVCVSIGSIGVRSMHERAVVGAKIVRKRSVDALQERFTTLSINKTLSPSYKLCDTSLKAALRLS